MNIVNYAYYRLYKALERSSLWNIAGFGAAMYLGGLIAINLITILIFAIKMDLMSIPVVNKYYWGGFCGIIGLLFACIYRTKRREKIVKHYENETPKQKLTGNIIVWSYIVLSLILIFVVPLYRPGYMGK